MYTLGIWDGHDAGVALVRGDQIVFAINEERLSRRKLEVGFPYRSIKACLNYEDIPESAITEIAISTSDPAKTLTRLVPSLREEYYLLRRRKKAPRRFDFFKKRFKYRFTELGPNPLTN
ncbi:MAG: carbamoyltransferase N-terminal domain-containing protein, partial [Pseudomonadota bacterium]